MTIPRVHHTVWRLAAVAGTIFLAHGLWAQASMVNVRHLHELTESIPFNGDTVDIVHVYANYPDYRWLDASDAGVEGTACVDDAARAAVFYLRSYEMRRDSTSLARAKALLRFVLVMQDEDGQFFNFIYRDHSINRTGRTSMKSFGWWAARATWALGTGYRIFAKMDPLFAGRLERALQRCIPHVTALLQRYGQTSEISGYRVPAWLLYGSGADVTSELLLGLDAYAAARRDTLLDRVIRQLADGLIVMQNGSPSRYPFGLHRSWETQWHMWGNGQTQFLAAAGKRLADSDMISSAELEANGWYSRLLIRGFLKQCDLSQGDTCMRFEQIAYAVRPMTVGLLHLYQATGQRKYLVMAGLAASWFFGDNVAGAPMYDPGTGRCYDGITDSATVNKNSGAESTIEALSTLQELESFPEASQYLHYTKVAAVRTGKWEAARFQNGEGGEVTIALRNSDGRLKVLEGKESSSFQARLQ